MPTEPTYVRNTILLKGRHHPYDEMRAAEAITPGMLIEKNADTTYDRDHPMAAGLFRKHATANGAGEAIVAIESVFTGDVITGQGAGIDQDYAANDLVRAHICQPGDMMWMFLKTGNNALLTSLLASAGDGTLQVSTINPMFKVVEPLNNTSGAKARIKVVKL